MMDWLAAALGLAAGLAFAGWIASAALPRLMTRSGRPELVLKLALGGTLAALLPALLLAIVIGAPFYGGLGVGVVFAVVLLIGLFAGVLLAKLAKRGPR